VGVVAHDRTELVFVYGTLRPGQANHDLIEAFVVDHWAATLPGYGLWSNGAFPAARPAAALVRGDLLQVEEPSEVLVRLDRLEGHPDFYRRRRGRVRTGLGWHEAWFYELVGQPLGWRRIGRSWPEPHRPEPTPPQDREGA